MPWQMDEQIEKLIILFNSFDYNSDINSMISY